MRFFDFATIPAIAWWDHPRPARRPRLRVWGWLRGAVLVALLPGCMPTVRGGPSLALAPESAASARVASLTMTSDWLRAGTDFAETFNEEVLTALSRCATGSRSLHLRVHVENVDRASRVDALIDGDRTHRIRGSADLIDPARRGQVVGRYPIDVSVDSGGPVGGLIGNRQMMLAQAFGRALCDAAFGTAAKAAAPWKITRDE